MKKKPIRKFKSSIDRQKVNSDLAKKKRRSWASYDPNTNYCGPKSITFWAPEAVNQACYKHDNRYGDNAANYLLPNSADDEFLKELRGIENKGWVGNVAQGIFEAKNAV